MSASGRWLSAANLMSECLLVAVARAKAAVLVSAADPSGRTTYVRLSRTRVLCPPGDPPTMARSLRRKPMSHDLGLRRRSLFAGAATALALPAIVGVRAAAAPSGDLVVAVPDNLVTLDPGDANDTLSQGVGRLMLEGLYGFDEDMKVVPKLAEAYTANATATEFTFTLRQGVSFHDGTPFDAEAVKFNLERVANPDNHLKRQSLLATLDRVEVVERYTAKAILKEPFGAFIPTIAHPSLALSSPAAVQKYGKEIGRHPVGTGPFVFTSWTPDTLKVHANPTYRVPGMPRVATITIRSVPENGSRLAMLQTGEAQFIFPMPPEMIPVVQNNPKIAVVEVPSIIGRGASLNLMKKPFDDLRVRQALNYAVDKEAYIKVVFSGHGEQLDSPEPPKITFYQKQGVWPFDLAKARQLLAEAGLAKGFETEIIGTNNTANVRGMEFLQQQFAQVGVKLNVSPLEAGVLASRVFSAATPEEATVQMETIGWSSSTGDADWCLRPMFAKAAFPPKMFNVSYYENPEVDKDLQAALQTADARVRGAAYADAQARIWQDCPWVWLTVDHLITARASNLAGAWRIPDGGLLLEDAHFT
jgi:glutathione transport system substrate-binding protein